MIFGFVAPVIVQLRLTVHELAPRAIVQEGVFAEIVPEDTVMVTVFGVTPVQESVYVVLVVGKTVFVLAVLGVILPTPLSILQVEDDGIFDDEYERIENIPLLIEYAEAVRELMVGAVAEVACTVKV